MWPKAALQMPRACEFRCLETANTGLFQVFVIYRDFGTLVWVYGLLFEEVCS